MYEFLCVCCTTCHALILKICFFFFSHFCCCFISTGSGNESRYYVVSGWLYFLMFNSCNGMWSAYVMCEAVTKWILKKGQGQQNYVFGTRRHDIKTSSKDMCFFIVIQFLGIPWNFNFKSCVVAKTRVRRYKSRNCIINFITFSRIHSLFVVVVLKFLILYKNCLCKIFFFRRYIIIITATRITTIKSFRFRKKTFII